MLNLSRVISAILVAAGTLILAKEISWYCALGVALVTGGAVIYIVGIKQAFGSLDREE